MYVALKWLYLMALIVWGGEVIFFSFVVRPNLSHAFPPPDFGAAVGVVFPHYHRFGYVRGRVLQVASLVFLGTGGTRVWWGINSALAAGMLAVALYAGVVIQPRAAALRPQIHDAAVPPAVKAEFDRLHGMAVMLNG